MNLRKFIPMCLLCIAIAVVIALVIQFIDH